MLVPEQEVWRCVSCVLPAEGEAEEAEAFAAAVMRGEQPDSSDLDAWGDI